MSEHLEKVFKSYQEGNINKYMLKKLTDIISSGVSDDLCEDLISDAQEASDAGVNSDKEYNVYFFAGHFVDDILQDTFGINSSPKQKKDICSHIVSHCEDEKYSLKDLTDFRILIHNWLCDQLEKRAYPNIGGEPPRMPQYDMNKWVTTLKKIYSSLRAQKMSKNDAFRRFTKDWDSDEKYDFESWMRYFEEGTPDKYNVRVASIVKEALGSELPPMPSSWYVDRAQDRPNMSTFKTPQKTEREKKIEEARQLKVKMRSRLRSLKKLVERYCDILSHQDIDAIYDEMYSLDKSINRLDVYASLQDRIIRSASKLEMIGFDEGAKLLKEAVEPNAPSNEEVLQSLPAPVDPSPDSTSHAPHVDINTIINRLAGVSKKLKSRDTIRELASIDILLNDLGLASYFPEITDAQSKLIESYGYASNKIESIIAKLRGSGTTTPQSAVAPMGQAPVQPPVPQSPALSPQKVDKGEIMDKPVGEVKQTLPPKQEG